MKPIDEQTLDRIIEQITSQVLLSLQEEPAAKELAGPAPLSAHDFVQRVQPVLSAGADRLASTLGVAPTDKSLAHTIDHTLLKPDATQDQIAQLCFEARKYGFASVCVNSAHVRLCADLLKGSGVPVCTMVGFPLGATPTDVKVFEAQQAIRDGASEVDMVINVGALKSRDYELVRGDIAAVARACHAGDAILKVIIEAALLTDEEKVDRLPAGQGRRRRLRQDLDRLRPRRRDRGRRGPDAPRGRSGDGGQGGRRHPHATPTPRR